MENEAPSSSDTIFALSSASGKAGVSIIRISGPKAWDTLKIFNSKVKYDCAREAKFLKLYHPKTGDVVDEVVFVGFKGPHSFTGEDVIELYCHGSLAVIEEIYEVLSGLDGLRIAEHGEFTRRAFENEKLDLTEAEAIADLIDAETKAQKDQALAQMGGSLSRLYNGWTEDLAKILAYAEAVIDFPDEEVPDDEIQKIYPDLEALAVQIKEHLDDDRRGERLREGIKIAVIGAPNAGKSTFINALANRDVAIVSDMAGTTRDIIEVHLNLGGYPVIIADTAGLRPELIGKEGHDAIESEGIRRALEYAENADLKILMFDGSQDSLHQSTIDLIDKNSIVLINKTDINKNNNALYKNLHKIHTDYFEISAQTGEGLSAMLEKLTGQISNMLNISRESATITRARYRSNLENTYENIQIALQQSQPELFSQELRFAINSLGRITGRIDAEDLLDIIFKDFCIGK
ncbi:MAG: tRNA uridine-5-carboxymethylaminomethyl(34) synthesis GTPase MnmE [Pseudomonadota bacterium]